MDYKSQFTPKREYPDLRHQSSLNVEPQIVVGDDTEFEDPVPQQPLIIPEHYRLLYHLSFIKLPTRLLEGFWICSEIENALSTNPMKFDGEGKSSRVLYQFMNSEKSPYLKYLEDVNKYIFPRAAKIEDRINLNSDFRITKLIE